MSPNTFIYGVASLWVAIVVVVAIDALGPLLVLTPTPATGRKLLRLSVLGVGLYMVLRVAFSIGGVM